jgi:glutaredoxin
MAERCQYEHGRRIGHTDKRAQQRQAVELAEVDVEDHQVRALEAGAVDGQRRFGVVDELEAVGQK